METGNIRWNVVTYYTSVIGWAVALTAVFFQLAFQACALGSNVWLGIWASGLNSTANESIYSRDTYLGVYALLCIGQGDFVLITIKIALF